MYVLAASTAARIVTVLALSLLTIVVLLALSLLIIVVLLALSFSTIAVLAVVIFQAVVEVEAEINPGIALTFPVMSVWKELFSQSSLIPFKVSSASVDTCVPI